MKHNNLLKSAAVALCTMLLVGCMHGQKKYEAAPRLLREGDVLEINVWQHTDLKKQAVVNEDGKIDYFFLGEISAAGRTVEEVRDILYNGLNEEYIKNPKVDVTLASESKVFFVGGEVNNPGTYPFRPNLSVIQVIAGAGGFTDFASKKVHIIRKDSAGKEYEIKVNAKDLLEPNEKRSLYTIQMDDIVVARRSWF